MNKPLKAVGSHDVLADKAAPYPVVLTVPANTFEEAVDFAMDNGLWFAGLEGAMEPEHLKRLVRGEGKTPWEALKVQVNPNTLPMLQLIDPTEAIQMLQARKDQIMGVIASMQKQLKA